MNERAVRARGKVTGEKARNRRGLVSLVALVAANVVRLFGVLFLGWDLGLIMALYWAENVIVGLYNVPRMVLAENLTPEESLGRLFLIPFFCIHYGFFCLVHGFFVLALFGHEGVLGMTGNDIGEWSWGLGGWLWVPVGAVVMSHGVSFWTSYVKGGEYRRAKLNQLMTRPYRRIVALHVALIVGGFGIGMLESRLPALAVLIVAKTAADAALHNRSHGKEAAAEGGPPSAAA